MRALRALVMTEVVGKAMHKVEKEVAATRGTTSMSKRGATTETRASIETTETTGVESAKES